MPEKVETAIGGVFLFRPTIHGDGRGTFFELFRASWLADDRSWVQWNVSRSKAGVLRGLHFHRRQSDLWFVAEGRMRVALVDLRPDSATHRQAVCLDLDGDTPQGLVIPPGVLHGYRAVRDITVMYLVDQEYDGQDEFGVRWDDPALGLPSDWYAGARPVLSPRDAEAPLLAEQRALLDGGL